MKNFLILLLIILIVGAMVFSILHISGIFRINEFVLQKLKENPKTADLFKTREEVLALSSQITELDTTITTKDDENANLQAQIQKLQKDIQSRDQNIEDLKKQIADLQAEMNKRSISVKQMTDIYSGMEPKKAADVLQGLDDDLVVQILQGLKKDIAAEIFSYFDPVRAAKLTNIYTEWEKK
jgi:flagellar protein FlbB